MTKGEILDVGVGLFANSLKIFGHRREVRLAARLVERLRPTATVRSTRGDFICYCPGKLPLWRAETALSKEPDTIAWIDAFPDGDLFWDIGANVGIYSLYAALRPAVKVAAFEPALANCYTLVRNIELNDMADRISLYCIAFSDTTSLDRVFMSTTKVGGALHSISQPDDWPRQNFHRCFVQSAIVFAMDDFVAHFRPDFPNHIKIDVDGAESRIIEGAKAVLSDRRLRSLLIELDTQADCYMSVVQSLGHAGLELKSQHALSEAPDSRFASVANHIFVRPG